MTPTFEWIALIGFLLIVISNIRFLHNMLTAMTNLVKDSINLLGKVGAISKQVEYNYNAIVKLDKELKIKGKRIAQYVQELHHQKLMNTGRIRILLKSYPIGLYECNKDGECIWVNNALCELFGMEHDEMLGNGWLGGILEDERSMVLEEWMTAIHKDIPYSWKYTVVNKKTGEIIKIKTISLTIRDDDKKPLLFFGSVERE